VLTSFVFIVVPTAIFVAVLLLVRAKLAPPGGWVGDMPAAGAIYSTAATGLAVLLAFLIIGTFESYQTARTATGTEAAEVQQMYSTALYFDQPYADQLRGDVLCYGRAVVSDDFPAMARGQEGQVAQYWVDRTSADMRATPPLVDTKQIEAFAHWLEVNEARQEARRSRLAEAQPFVPGFLWAVLLLITVVVLAFQVLFADPAARRLGQVMAMVAMALAFFSALTLVWVLDRPFHDRGAAIPHNRMSASLGVMQRTAPATLPCDGDGNPR
jgi:hypothetical protein